MGYVFSDPEVGLQGITVTDTVQNHTLGAIRKAKDVVTYGEGEFVYLKGLAATAVGSVVIFDQKAATTTLATAGSRGPVAIAMSANVANQYGWYQISGSAVAKAATVLAGGKVYATATPDTVDDAVVAGDKIDGAIFKTADGTPSAGLAVVQIARPCMSGNG